MAGITDDRYHRTTGFHRERDTGVYTYTIEDIAEIAGSSLRMAKSRLPGYAIDLQAAASYIYRMRLRTSKPVPPETWCRESMLPLWENRWPVLDFFNCASAICSEMVFGAPGLCAYHGGWKPAWDLNPHQGYMLLRVDDTYKEFHRVLLGADAAGHDIHHEDFNRWNNRVSNLRIMSHREHMALHARRSPPEALANPSAPKQRKAPPMGRRMADGRRPTVLGPGQR